jgi:pimeloyl-ACP methyl ester carboxylesterase
LIYTVILAHGFACTSIVFDGLFNDAQLNAAVYLVHDLIKTIRPLLSLLQVQFDTRGHGRSGKPLEAAAYESERYAQDISALISAYGLQQPFFAGWSLGGAISADIAAVSIFSEFMVH